MSYLVDSDYVADYLKGKREAVALLSRLAPEGFAISLITFGEIYEGIYYGRDAVTHERGFRHFLRIADVLPLNKSILRRFARIRGDLRRRGQLIGDPDILIAVTAIHHERTLLSRNLHHFRRISDVRLFEES